MELFHKLGNKRILQYNHGLVEKEPTIMSLSNIREYITDAIVQLNGNSEVIKVLDSMRMIVQGFQTYIEKESSNEFDRFTVNHELIQAVDEMRKELKINIDTIVNGLNLELPDSLTKAFLLSV